MAVILERKKISFGCNIQNAQYKVSHKAGTWACLQHSIAADTGFNKQVHGGKKHNQTVSQTTAGSWC